MASMTQQLLKHQFAQRYDLTDSYSWQHPKQKTKEKSVVLTHLQRLEAESIQAMREVVAEAENPVMLYSIGKDSAVMLHLAMKAFYPAKPPFPLLHVDTTWKFQDMYRFRDQMAAKLGMDLLVQRFAAELKRFKREPAYAELSARYGAAPVDAAPMSNVSASRKTVEQQESSAQ